MGKTPPTVAERRLEDSEIIQQLLQELRFSGLKFAKTLGYSSAGTIHHILSGKNKISDDLVNTIIKHFPEVNYWFLKAGKLPILLDDKLARNQSNVIVGRDNNKPDYSLETFTTLKNIEVTLGKILEVLESKK